VEDKNTRRSLMRWDDKYKKDGELTGYNRIPKVYKVHKEIKKNKTKNIHE
jgi:hypothetical protein